MACRGMNDSVTMRFVLAGLLVGACSGQQLSARPGEAPVDPGPSVLRRLTHAQYTNTVRAVLGAPVRGVNLEEILGSDRGFEGFSNGPHQSAPSTTVAQSYATAARALAAAATTPKCGGSTACLRGFVGSHGRRLFRRPLTEAELDGIVAGAKKEAPHANDPRSGARHALEVMLQAVPFLYVLDEGPAGRRDPHALVTRLALLLWNSGPDDRLLDLADQGGLGTRASVTAEVSRMLGDPRARATARHFFHEWLGYDLVTRASKERRAEFQPDFRLALVAETDRLVDHFVAAKSPVMDLFRADFTFADDSVRRFYGIEGDTTRATLPAARRGILGHASFIAANSGPSNQSPTLRGLAVLNRFLCGEVSSPPPTAPTELPESEDNVPRTIRERTEQFMLANDRCNHCHEDMDGIGFLFENFDVLGRFRTTEAVAGAAGGNKPVDATGSIVELGIEKVDGLPGLATALATHAVPRQCFLRHVLRFGLARDDLPSDAPTLATMRDAYDRDGGSFLSVIGALASSDALLYTRGAP